MKKRFVSMMIFGLLLMCSEAQVTSVLWGVSGEAWNTNGLLRDFTTDVGYQGTGAVDIPDWPVWTNLTDMGAVVDDHISDVAALRAAISNCPPYHTIFLPNGTYTIDEQIIMGDYDNIVIRGESRDGTILFFPKHMNEIKRTITASDPFIIFSGGMNRGIENLSLVFRDEQKATGYVNRHLSKENDPHWWYNGENPLRFSGYENNSWARNIYIKNANHAITISNQGTRNITLINIVLDQFIGRTSFVESTDGHMGIQVGDAATRCLVHNVLMTGSYVHDICTMGTQNSVFSRISGPGVKLDHHANGNSRNLFTEVDYGNFSGYGEDYNNSGETYWGLNGINNASYLPTTSKSVFVGVKTSAPTSIGATWHHETLDPDAFAPANLYLAQLAYHGKDAPADMTLTLPPITAPYRMLAVDDAYVYVFDTDANYNGTSLTVSTSTRSSFMKFDLSSLGITNAACAKLKIKSGGTANTPLGLRIWDVSDDSWSERTLCYTNRPAAGSVILSSNLYNSGWTELDLTSYVNSELAGDQIVSISLTGGAAGGNKDASIWFRSAEGGNAAELVIHTDASTVAPPATPTGLIATPGDAMVTLDWNDNTEDDFASYSVYRSTDGGANYVIDAMGLVTSDYDGSWVANGTTYYFKVVAVDTAGTESLLGAEVSVIPLDPNNQPPAFTSDPVVETNAVVDAVYSATLANDASDPDEDPMSFSLLSSPTWLSVAADGGLSGTPGPGHIGTNTFTVEVTALGGSATGTVQIVVEIDPLLPPAAPTGLSAAPADGSVTLNWNDNGESDLAGYSVYRSTTSGSYGSALTNGLSSSDYVDNTVSNGTAYYYVVTATDTNSNESADSSEVSATPFAAGATETFEASSAGSSTPPTGWTLVTTAGSPTYSTSAAGVGSDGSGGSAGLAGQVSSTDYPDTALPGGFLMNSHLFSMSASITISFDFMLVSHSSWDDVTFTIGDIADGFSLSSSGELLSLKVTETGGTTLFSGLGSGGSELDSTAINLTQNTWYHGTFIWTPTGGTTGDASFNVNNFSSDVYTLSASGFTFDSDTAQVGFGSVNDTIRFDNVSFTGPSELTAYEQWATGWNTDIGVETNDFDADGLSNFGEYALGGNPTNALAHGSMPVFLKSGNGFIYLHPKRSDDSSLVYTVETSTNLLDSASWTNQGYTVTGTNITGETLDFVSNEVDTVDDEKFIRLKVQQ